jgi:hypothetical protein
MLATSCFFPLLLLVVNRFDQHNLSFLGDEKKGQAIQSGLHNTCMSSKAGSTISEQIGAERRGGKGVATEQRLGIVDLYTLLVGSSTENSFRNHADGTSFSMAAFH